jgi:hypothetical protein
MMECNDMIDCATTRKDWKRSKHIIIDIRLTIIIMIIIIILGKSYNKRKIEETSMV